jgi:hypothetical protein
MSECCETCRFWKDFKHNLGVCQRYAPKPAAIVMPGTDQDDWCGEHQPIPNAYQTLSE